MLGFDPCDGWPWAWPQTGYRWRADRAQPLSIEGFPHRETPLPFARFLPWVRSDWHHWRHELDWTVEAGTDDLPVSLDIAIPYSYSWGGDDYFAGGCWNPGDPPELEVGVAYYLNEFRERCELSLLPPEQERVDLYIAENPPEPDYGDDY